MHRLFSPSSSSSTTSTTTTTITTTLLKNSHRAITCQFLRTSQFPYHGRYHDTPSQHRGHHQSSVRTHANKSQQQQQSFSHYRGASRSAEHVAHGQRIDALAKHFLAFCDQHDFFRSAAMRKMFSRTVEEGQGQQQQQQQQDIVLLRARRFVETVFAVDHNAERNAYLMGSSVTNMCIADYLYGHFPNLKHDHLVATLLQFTKTDHMSAVARESLQLHTFLQRNGELLNMEKFDFDSFLQSTLLRIIGTIHLEHGLFDAREFVVEHIVKRSVDISPFLESYDPKTELKELIKAGAMKQHVGKHVIFSNKLVKRNGPFKVQVLANTDVLGEAVAQTVKIGEMKSAQDALNRFYSEFCDDLTPLQREMSEYK